MEVDSMLDLVEPLFKAGNAGLSVRQVQEVREQLQLSISTNKKRGHELLTDNFPTVSAHIRLGNELQGNFDKLESTLGDLERQIDPNDEETSFLPPVLSLLDRHFAAVRAKAQAEAHVQALKALSGYTGRIQELETAIWAGRGADEWVVSELLSPGFEVGQGHDTLQNTKPLQLAQNRLRLFRSMVEEQVTDAFGKAIAISDAQSGQHGVTISVQSRTSLQQPRIPRPESADSPAKPSIPPPYSLPHIYTTLSAFSTLTSILTNVRIRIVRDVVPPLASGDWKATTSDTESVSAFRLIKTSEKQQPAAILDDVSTLLCFIDGHIFPPLETLTTERQAFVSEIHTAIFQAILDSVILTAMPSSLPAIPKWLELIHRALDIEEKHSADEYKAIVKPFFEVEAGRAWANQRRCRVAEEARKLIVGGWGGWEAKEAEREREVTVVVEVEVDDEVEAASAIEKEEENPDAFGWGFEDDSAAKKEVAETVPSAGAAGESDDANMDAEDGWGFDESAQAGPSSPRTAPTEPNGRTANSDEGEGDGWDFDDTTAAPAPEPLKPVLAKPAREAKRLGKKVAKVKAEVEDDPWGSGSESTAPAPVAQPLQQDEPEPQHDGWGWEEPLQTPAAPEPATEKAAPVRIKRKELKEEKKTIRETFLISRACDKLVDMAERVLREAKDLESTSLPSPSFAFASEILFTSASDVFDLHRSLLPSHYALQIKDVPTLSMQVHNDALHLVDRVAELQSTHAAWSGARDIIERLRALADHAFESQLASQRDGLMEAINQAEGFTTISTDAGLQKAERAISSVVHSIDTLSRILRVVLPTTIYMIVLGYLLDEAVTRIVSDITDLQDITEIESNRLNEVLEPIRTLEEIFIVEPGQPSSIVAHVPHWLKFCYISELLQANLVDILYLHDSGALVDFTTGELVSLLRALFADSEKRDDAIERIEQGVPKPVKH